jgi:hypothetical protein
MKPTGTSLLVAALMAFSSSAFGAVVIDFGTGSTGPTGTYTLSADGQNATGTGIAVGVVTVVGTAFDGSYDTSGACANQTGGDSNGSACLSFDTAANTISIVGDVSALGVPNTTLLSGSFSSFNLLGGNGIFGSGPDTKSPLLLAALGLAADLPFEFFGFSITTTVVAPGASGSAISTDIRNTAVPEPSAVVLFVSMLLGCSALLRRRAANKA